MTRTRRSRGVLQPIKPPFIINWSSCEEVIARKGRRLRLQKTTNISSPEKSLFLQLFRSDKFISEWYKVDLSAIGKGCPPSNISKFLRANNDAGVAFTGSGSVLYSVGGGGADVRTGQIVPCKNVSFFDQNHPEKKLQNLPEMSTARYLGYAMVLKNKLFVFGGCPAKETFGEYYDLENVERGAWVEIRPPTSLCYPFVSVMYATAYGDSCIYVVFHKLKASSAGYIFIYNIESGSWEQCEIPYGLVSYLNEKPIIVDHTLCWLRSGYDVCAYDFISHKYFESYLKAPKDTDIKYPQIVHLGGTLFCTLSMDPSQEFSHSDLHSTISVLAFQISKTANGGFDASLCYTGTIMVDGRPGCVDIHDIISLNCNSTVIENGEGMILSEMSQLKLLGD